MEPKFSDGADQSELKAETEALLEGGWTLDEAQMGVSKTYYFKTYSKCLVGTTPGYAGA
jgi:4a-hydroxytetrahydrobiopterin dehydratase